MNNPCRIVFTGGPQGGKSTTIRRLRDKYGDEIITTGEVSSTLMKDLLPQPGRDLPLSDEWLIDFQIPVYHVQRQLEIMWTKIAESENIKLVIFDRGRLDGGAYMPGGINQFMRAFNLTYEEVFLNYDQVFHFETLAKTRPDLFGQSDNDQRYEQSANQAVALDYLIQDIWKNHPNWQFIPSSLGIDGIFDHVENLIQPYL